MSWQIKKSDVLANARCIVVKVGSAVLTTEQGLNLDILQNIVKQLAILRNTPIPAHKSTLRKILLVSSGAVATGRAALGNLYTSSNLPSQQGAASVGQSRLMHAYDSAFAAHNIISSQVLLTRDDLKERQRFLNIRNTLAKLLQWNIIPVINENDTVSTNEIKFGDNDCLASLLVNVVEADLFINLTSAEGVFTSSPLTDPNATLIPYIDDVCTINLDEICGEKTAVGTGGMHSKLLAAQRIAQLGVPTLILSGKISDIVTKAFSPNSDISGTWITCGKQVISRRKFWLAYQSKPQGCIQIDKGAALALTKNGSSLLPVGIIDFEGKFNSGDLISIEYNSEKLGVGISNYSAEQLKPLIGLKRHEISAILGYAHYPEVVHRDNLLLEALI